MSKSSYLLLAVLASVPIQLGKFIFLDHSFVLGIPIDYRALAIYFSDLIVISYIFVFIFENRLKLPKLFKKNKEVILSLVIFNSYLLLNAAFSTSKLPSLIFSLKIIILSTLSIFALYTFSQKLFQRKTKTILSQVLFLESAIIIGQFVLQKSLGLWILGERSFDSTTVSIAHTQVFGRELLRSYGTFPHPNVAAAFIVFSLIIASSYLFKGPRNKLILALAAIAILLTFSKSAIIVLFISLIILFYSGKKLILLFFSLFTFGFFWATTYLSSPVATIAERLLLAQVALDISGKNLLFGVGSNNFILELSSLHLTSLSQTRLLQPVHNVFLLILTENGIIGLLLFTLVLFVVSKNIKNKTSAALFVGILIYASVDHFLWTLHQGQLLFFLSISFILSFKNKA